MKIRDIIQRWTRREEVALRHQFRGETTEARFRGIWRSERNEAKLFLLALIPVIATGPFIGKWSDASFLGKTIMSLAGLWMVIVLVAGGFLFFVALFRASRKRSD